MKTQPDLNDLRMVALISHWGGLAAAAQELGISFTTVFRRLEAMEARLGLSLFERRGGQYVATPAGQKLAEAGEAITLEAQQALQMVAGEEISPSGLVRIGTTEGLAHYLMPPIMQACHHRHEGITLQVTTSSLLSDLGRREIDIAMRTTNNPPEDLVGQRVAAIGYAVYGLQSRYGNHPQKTWIDQTWLGLEEELSHHATWQWLTQQKLQQRVVFRSNSFLLLSQACASGLGLAVLPCLMGDALPTLERLTPPIPDCESSLWLLSHPDLRRVARVSMVKKTLLQSLQAMRTQLEGTLSA